MELRVILFVSVTIIHILEQAFSGKMKQTMTFDQIFGEGWDKMAKNCHGQCDQSTPNDQIVQEIFRHQFDQIFDINENCDDSEDEINEMAQNDDQTAEELSENGDQNESEEQKKKEIIRKFHVLKEKIKQKGRWSTEERAKFERIIARKLGTNRKKIYGWKKDFGLSKSGKAAILYSEQQKREIIRKFNAIKEKIKEKRTHSAKKWNEIECIIAKKLGTNRKKIYEWKKELVVYQSINYSDQQKKGIINKFYAIKEKIKPTGKRSRKERTKIEEIIAKKLGANRVKIYKWIKAFGMGRKRLANYSDSTKIALIEQFDAMKNELKQKRKYTRKEWRQNYAKIGKTLDVNLTTIQRWKNKLGISDKQYANEQKMKKLGNKSEDSNQN